MVVVVLQTNPTELCLAFRTLDVRTAFVFIDYCTTSGTELPCCYFVQIAHCLVKELNQKALALVALEVERNPLLTADLTFECGPAILLLFVDEPPVLAFQTLKRIGGVDQITFEEKTLDLVLRG